MWFELLYFICCHFKLKRLNWLLIFSIFVVNLIILEIKASKEFSFMKTLCITFLLVLLSIDNLMEDPAVPMDTISLITNDNSNWKRKLKVICWTPIKMLFDYWTIDYWTIDRWTVALLLTIGLLLWYAKHLITYLIMYLNMFINSFLLQV